MNSESEQDARVQELADVITPRLAEAIRGEVEGLRQNFFQPGSPYLKLVADLQGATTLAEQLRIVRESGVQPFRESEAGAAFIVRSEAIERSIDSLIEEWGEQRGIPSAEVRPIGNRSRMIAEQRVYQEFGIDPPKACPVPPPPS